MGGDPTVRRQLETLRRDAVLIFRAGLEAADPARAVRGAVQVAGGRVTIAGQPLPAGVRRLRAVAFGKAACLMAQAAAEILPPGALTGQGLAVTSRDSPFKSGGRLVERFRVVEAGHPLPDAAGLEAARAVEDAVRGMATDELALVLVSGGASALLPAPAPGLTLEEKVETTRLLLRAGADIRELNTVRKHLSRLKGGGLARAASPGHVRALLLSDVPGDDPSVIASGPVSPDPSTFAEALAVLERRGLIERVPRAVRGRLEAGAAGQIPETPKPGDPLFQRVEAVVVGSNALSLEACLRRAAGLGYRTEAPWPLEGEARAAAARYAAEGRLRAAALPAGERLALLAGGETTVTVRGPGRGGRSQEMALALALELERDPPGCSWAFLAAGTDGVDGPTDAAGAVVDTVTPARVRRQDLDPARALEENDSHTALEAAGDLLLTGPTGTNVADLAALLLWKAGD